MQFASDPYLLTNLELVFRICFEGQDIIILPIQSSSEQISTSGMSSAYDSSSSSGRASPDDIETFWVWYPAYIQTQLDKQSPRIANPFVSDPSPDSDTDESSQSALDELEDYINELLRAHHSNQEAHLLSGAACPLDTNELVESSKELAVDPEDIFLLEQELLRTSSHLLESFPGPVPYDNILATPTTINPGQEAVGRWLKSVVPPTPTLPPLPLPEPMFDANFESFLLSPTISDAEDSPLTTSQDLDFEPANSSASSSEDETDESNHASCPEDNASERYFAKPTHITCHSHNSVFHADVDCACNCGSHCEFLRKNSRHFKCECDCECHTCFSSHQSSAGTISNRQYSSSRDSIDTHLESLDLAERGVLFGALSQTELETTPPARQESETHHAFFLFSSPDSQLRLQPVEIEEPYLIWSDDVKKEEDPLDLDGEW